MDALVILVGLPGAGKTKWAEDQQEKSEGKIVIVSRDDFREKFFRADGVLSPAQENFITAVETYAVTQALREGFKVIVDSTNLKPYRQEHWRSVADAMGCPFTTIKFMTSVAECIRRDKERGLSGEWKAGRSVGAEVIMNMAHEVYGPPETW